MGSEFAAIGVGLSGIEAAREELDVTGNNIANASTPGYVRERVNLASQPAPTPTLLMSGGGSGQGVIVLGTTRLVDNNADAQALAAQGNAALASETQSVLSQAQAALNEPGASGISSQLSTFWSQWDAVANNPTDQAARATLLSSASSLAAAFNQTSNALAQVRSSASSAAVSDATQINQLAAQVAQLNSEVVGAQAGGSDASGLADQRSTIVGQLAQLAGVTVRPEANGAVDVLLGPELLVQGTIASKITASANPATAAVSLTFPDGSTVAAGGELGALAQAVNSTLPGYLSQLDSAAVALANAVNAQQAAGVTWTGVGTPSQASAPGQAMFTGTTAATLSLAPGMTGAGIAAGAPSAGPGDGSNAQLMAEIGNASGGADAIYRGFVGQVGTDVSAATTHATATATIKTQATAQQQSSEGVNLDEELANMTQFQVAYSASGKYLAAVDQTIQTLLSIVG